MRPDRLRELLERVARGETEAGAALEELKHLPFADLGFARVDHHRQLRSGVAEVIYGEGKQPEQIIAIAREMLARGSRVLVTRLASGAAQQLCAAIAEMRYDPIARAAYHGGPRIDEVLPPAASVALVSAGTADQAVAAEAALTLEFLGVRCRRFSDVGVAGIHRLLADREAIGRASVAIVVAGMEGALPSVVGGLVDLPVIAVPTSIGYGASFGGLAALLAMLNSCAAGVTVVNIDNGFGAAVAAAQILRAGASLHRGTPRVPRSSE